MWVLLHGAFRHCGFKVQCVGIAFWVFVQWWMFLELSILLVQEFVLLPFNHGKGSKVPFHSFPKPTKSLFSNKDLVWTFGICHGGQNKVNIQFVYVHKLASQKSLKVNKGYGHPHEMECLQKISKLNRCQTTNYQKPPRAYMVNIHGINIFNFFNSYTKNVIIYNLNVFWSRY